MILTVMATVLVTLLPATVAMNFATAEKKLERKIEHRYAIADPQFRREMSLMMSPSIVGGNRVDALQNGEEIFPAMLQAFRQAFRQARESITFETYIYWSGEIGREFSEAPAERASSGVPVHVTLDWAGSVKMDSAWKREYAPALSAGHHRVRVLLPGPHIDSFTVRIASKQVWGALLRARNDRRLREGPETSHGVHVRHVAGPPVARAGTRGAPAAHQIAALAARRASPPTLT